MKDIDADDAIEQALMEEALSEAWKDIMKNREEIMKAFIAEHGYKPSEVTQVVQYYPNGVVWRVVKTDDAGTDTLLENLAKALDKKFND